ncbi:MAG TPA: hypothetical protein VKP13_14375 [Nitrospira sp.]|nr:hypothetical protein [Nitrospira sp.]
MMRGPLNHRVLLAIVVWTAFLIVPLIAKAATDTWLDQLTAMLVDHRHFAMLEGREAAYEPYFAQLDIARIALNRGDTEGVYVAMNRFMDMLEHAPEARGIPLSSAKMLFDFCGEVTPPMYHDVSRHGARKSA